MAESASRPTAWKGETFFLIDYACVTGQSASRCPRLLEKGTTVVITGEPETFFDSTDALGFGWPIELTGQDADDPEVDKNGYFLHVNSQIRHISRLRGSE